MNKERIDEILDSIENEAELGLFFKKLFQDGNYHKLFFMRKNILFPTENDNSLKYLFWNNIKDDDEFAWKILANQAEIKSMRTKKDQESVSGITTEGLEKPLQDLIMYIVIEYVRDNPEVKKLIEGEKFNYTLMKQTLRDYKKLNNKVFNRLQKVQSNINIDDLDFTNLILSVTNTIQRGFTNLSKDVGYFLPSLAENRPELFFQVHLNYHEHLKSLLKQSKLSKHEYTSILNDAFSIKSISNQHTMFWCANCVDENITLNTDSSLHPSHLKLQCPRCSKDMLVSSVFQLDDLIEECIMDNDGLLKIATEWQLRINQIEFETIKDEKYEYDLVCTFPSGKALIECRMHKSVYDEETLKTWIRNDLTQLTRHYKEIKDAHKIKYPIFLSNIDVNKNIDLIGNITKEFGQEFVYANIAALPYVIQKMKTMTN